MDTWVLVIFLAYTVPAGVDGVGGGAALTSEKHVFWSKADCLAARVEILNALEKAQFKRAASACLKSSGPGNEEPKLGMKGG